MHELPHILQGHITRIIDTGKWKLRILRSTVARNLWLERPTARKHRPPGRIIEYAWTSIRPGMVYIISMELATTART